MMLIVPHPDKKRGFPAGIGRTGGESVFYMQSYALHIIPFEQKINKGSNDFSKDIGFSLNK